MICLDVLRALDRNPATRDAFLDECRKAAGSDARLDRWLAALESGLAAPDEAGARRLVERMGLALQARSLVRHGDPAVADAFCASGSGATAAGPTARSHPVVDCGAVLERHRPQP